MPETILVRRAEKKDIDFLAKMILLAESSGFELISYEKMFKLDYHELLNRIKLVINNNNEGHGLTYHSFLIAEVNGISAGTSSGYIEGECGNSSHLMTGALMEVFSTEEMLNAYKINRVYQNIYIEKEKDSVQIDSVATLSEFRGRGIFRKIFEEHCRIALKKNCNLAEIQVWKGNEIAIKTYQKLGFQIKKEKVLEGNSEMGRVLMTKEL